MVSVNGVIGSLGKSSVYGGGMIPMFRGTRGRQAGGHHRAWLHVGRLAHQNLSPAGEERDKEAAAGKCQRGCHGTAFCFLPQR